MLDNFQRLIKQDAGILSHHGIPAVRASVLWNLLDPHSTSSAGDSSPVALVPAGECVPTQYLAQLHECSSPRDDGRTEVPSVFQGSPSACPMDFQDFIVLENLLGSVNTQDPYSSQLQYLTNSGFLGDL